MIGAARYAPHYGGQRDLNDFIGDPDRPWNGGPFSEPVRRLLTSHATDLAHLVAGFERLVVLTAPPEAASVITHGEPHPANLMLVDDRLFLVDWDTAALAPPERDPPLLATTGGRMSIAISRRLAIKSTQSVSLSIGCAGTSTT